MLIAIKVALLLAGKSKVVQTELKTKLLGEGSVFRNKVLNEISYCFLLRVFYKEYCVDL